MQNINKIHSSTNIQISKILKLKIKALVPFVRPFFEAERKVLPGWVPLVVGDTSEISKKRANSYIHIKIIASFTKINIIKTLQFHIFRNFKTVPSWNHPTPNWHCVVRSWSRNCQTLPVNQNITFGWMVLCSS